MLQLNIYHNFEIQGKHRQGLEGFWGPCVNWDLLLYFVPFRLEAWSNFDSMDVIGSVMGAADPKFRPAEMFSFNN